MVYWAMSFWSKQGTKMNQVPKTRKYSGDGEEEPLLNSTSSLQGNNRSIINAGTVESSSQEKPKGVG